MSKFTASTLLQYITGARQPKSMLSLPRLILPEKQSKTKLGRIAAPALSSGFLTSPESSRCGQGSPIESCFLATPSTNPFWRFQKVKKNTGPAVSDIPLHHPSAHELLTLMGLRGLETQERRDAPDGSQVLVATVSPRDIGQSLETFSVVKTGTVWHPQCTGELHMTKNYPA